MATQGGPARRVVVVSGAGLRVLGGPSQPIKLMPANTPTTGDPILRVVVVSDGRASLGGPAWPCVQVSGAAGLGGDLVPVTLT